MKKEIKIILFGILSWLIPFAVSMFFYNKEGRITIDIFLFKSIMILTGSLAGAFLMNSIIKKYYIKKGEGLIIGLIWYIINIGLDLIILLPMAHLSIVDYFYQMGIRYLIIPIMCGSIGYAANNRILQEN